jgi:hypothetical protein
VLAFDQRRPASRVWLQLTDEDLARLDGSCAAAAAHLDDVMRREHLSRDAVWDLTRRGLYQAFRVPHGQCWEWGLKSERRFRQLFEIGADHHWEMDANYCLSGDGPGHQAVRMSATSMRAVARGLPRATAPGPSTAAFVTLPHSPRSGRPARDTLTFVE